MRRKSSPDIALARTSLLKPDRDDAATLRLLVAIARAFKFVDDQVRPKMASYGLSMTEFTVLETLFHMGPLPLSQLSDRILITGASTTYTVKKLEARGLMQRRPSPEDSRVVLGSVTAKGVALLQRVFPLHIQDLKSAMAGLTQAEKNAATALLRKLQNLQERG